MNTPTWWPKGVLTPAEAAYQLRNHPVRSLFLLYVGGLIGWAIGSALQ